MSRRIVIEEDCVAHETHWMGMGWPDAEKCPGGSRTVLTEPTEEMVERAAREWAAAWGYTYDNYDESYHRGWQNKVRPILTAALFSSDAGEREETE